ncbi:AraC family transcriptional regulator [Paenibacillus sp. TRM 82003]|uniref:AraC family transcriptional regulator n=1 Tax=Kineococcus sp. TRM81007 TaxID=2925831 RepID=UPI001F57D338|nr:AraC family transcriptional regulator [Kineococcus sp. TRM81007]MCI2238363.1 AraC family transcriptional regulator [Kineococcus sp. TRM81007]MCI3922123.1 AraC family transcriptional regulator [Paenibacillus sp. TRM 82003]
MDAFSDLIRGVRAHGSLFGSSTLTAPWALHFVDGAPLTLCTVLTGAGWIVPEHEPPERVGAHETVLVRGPGTFTFVDEVGTGAVPIVCGTDCATPEQGGTRHRLGWHDPGGSRDDESGATTLIVGAYPARGEIGRRLLEALPVVLRVGAGGATDPVLDVLAAEVAVDAPGQQVVLDRLLDWVLVCTLREFFDRPGVRSPGWWAAQRDPVAGNALRLLHAEPAAPWTVAALAERAGVSRATLAKRFSDLVGEPPLTYLTRWRMTLAADLLLEQPSATVAHVARTVGYSDPFGFSAAFKRVRGVSPSEFRRLTTTASPEAEPPVAARAGSGGRRP